MTGKDYISEYQGLKFICPSDDAQIEHTLGDIDSEPKYVTINWLSLETSTAKDGLQRINGIKEQFESKFWMFWVDAKQSLFLIDLLNHCRKENINASAIEKIEKIYSTRVYDLKERDLIHDLIKFYTDTKNGRLR